MVELPMTQERAPATTSSGYERKHPVGVQGWLRWVCVVMTIIGPGVRLDGILTDAKMYSRLISPEWRNWVVCADLAHACVALFLLYAGVCLWTLRPGAVGKAQAALGVAAAVELTLSIVKVHLLGTAWHPSSALAAVGGSIVWISYLGISNRVKNTYES